VSAVGQRKTVSIDLNADVGEVVGDDEGVLPSVSSANIACGFHAGNPVVMRTTVQLARRHGVAVGAHPGFQDLEGFGRREMRVSTAELENLIAYQIGALAGVAAVEGVRLSHVKPHGALYNMAARDAGLADAIARAVRAVDASLVLFGLSGSELVAAGERAGLRVASEAFADRGYWPNGNLAPRGTPGAVMTGVEDVVRRTGRAERTEDPMPHTLSDVLVTLKPDRSRELSAIEDDMRERLEGLPGIAVLFTTPLGMRIDEGLGGTPADISVLLTGVYLGATALIGVGIGTMVRHSGAAIGTLFGLTFVPMVAIGLFGESGIAVGRYVPLLMLLNSIAVTSPVPGLFSGGISALLMCGYAAAAVLGGGVLLRRRDA